MEEKIWFKHYPKEVPHQIEIPDIPLCQILVDSAEQFPENTALVLAPMEAKMTYRELNERSDCLAQALQKLGIEKGDRVAIILPNSFEFVTAFFGTLKAGAVVVPLNPRYTPRELEYLLANSGTKVMICLEQMYPMVAQIKDKTALSQLITVPIGTPSSKLGLSFSDLMAEASPKYASVGIDPGSDLAALQYTAGTTAGPKGAMLTHRNIVSEIVQIQSFCWPMKKEGQEVFLIVVPPFHVAGIVNCVCWAVYIGAVSVLLSKFDPVETLKAFSRYRPTFFFGVPAIYKAILEAKQKIGGEWLFDSLKFAAIGTAPCPPLLLEASDRTFPNFTQGYGLTESTGVCFANPIMGLKKIDSVGIPFPGVDIKIVDVESGKELNPREKGETLIKGPNIALGYWKLPEETEKTFRNGWLHTGDIGYLDEDGYLHIVDRIKDIINVRGEKVSSIEIEQVLESHPNVGEAAVIGVADPFWGEKVVAYLVLKEPIETVSIQTYCQKKLVDYKVPQEIKIVNSLPRSSMGKVLKRNLKGV